MTKRETTQKRVLFFDDEPVLNEALAESLKLFNWEVIMVSRIDMLFKELLCSQFDILILDIMAPVPEMENEYINFTKKEIENMDGGINTGIVLAKKIWEIHNDIPILFLSARQKPESITFFQKEGKSCDWLRKPELVSVIIDGLNNLLNV